MTRELDSIFGNNYLLSIPGGEEAEPLPLYIKLNFACYRVSLPEGGFIIVSPRRVKNLTVAAVEKPLLEIARSYRMPAVLYSAAISGRLAAQLRAHGISYISTYMGFYLPSLGMLAPNYGRGEERQAAYLSPSAQAIVLRQLLYGDVDGVNVRSLAETWPYSAMLLGIAKNELVAHGLCEYPPGTRSGEFHFMLGREELWKAAAPLLRSPVRMVYRVRREQCKGFPHAGVSALSRMTMLADDMLPTYAYYARKKQDRIPPAAVGEGDAVLQLWSYPPRILVDGDSETVDPCSLYLSLTQDADPRVEMAREQIWKP